jgi:hypothetical protein
MYNVSCNICEPDGRAIDSILSYNHYKAVRFINGGKEKIDGLINVYIRDNIKTNVFNR